LQALFSLSSCHVKNNIRRDYIQGFIDVRKIDPAPYQHRRHFDEGKLKELAASIQSEGLIEPIVVRPVDKRYQLIAGERRLRAVRNFTEMETIQAQIVIASNLQARRISAAENMQREDLSAIETIEAIVEIVDTELIEDIEYLSMGKTPADRVKTLLGKLDSVRRSKGLGYEVGTQARLTSHKFVGSIEKIFKNLPKPLEWRSFYNHDLPLLIDFCEEVQEVSIQPQLSQKCSIGRSLLYVIRYLTRYHLAFDNSIPARFRVPEFGNSPERERPARLALRSIPGRHGKM